jgi:AraC-like DNA-binding protein
MLEYKPPMRTHVSTDSFGKDRRLAQWSDVYGRGITTVDIEPIGDTPFRADVTFDVLPAVSIASGSRTPAHYRVTRDLLSRSRDIIAIGVLRSGQATATQFGKELIGGVDGAIVLTNTDPWTTSMTAESSFVTIALSRPAIMTRVPHLADAFGHPIHGDNAALRLLVRYLDFIGSGDPFTDSKVAMSASDHIMDLSALALGARGDHAELARQRGATAVRLAALKADIVGALGRFELSGEWLAARHGISPRYVRKLFEQSGESFAEFVTEQRLMKARLLLIDRRRAGSGIAEIAHESGFGDVSHFNRLFRRRFTATPTDIRHAARQLWLARE